MDFESFRRKPLLGIVRGIEPSDVEPLVGAVIAAGLETLEITMNTAAAPELIARAKEVAAGRLTLGAGTVLGEGDLDRALDAGASFIVMPTLVDEVARGCRDRGVPFFPGALTPQEIHDAWRAGACMVKVFPARFFGPEYFREIKGPFDDVLLLACGGVSAASLPDYAACGADGFAVGGSLFDRERIRAGAWSQIESGLRELVEVWERTTRA